MGTLWFFLVSLLVATCSGADKPNIVFFVADDLGWNDVGYNNPDIRSPNIDSLAASGVTLTQSYVQPVCSPSRSAFMTGSYPFTMGLSHLVIMAKQAVCAPLNKTFLPQVFKKNGYDTHMIGKWHLGFCNWNCTPTYRGFDSFLGYYNGMEDYYTKVTGGGYDFRLNEHVDLSANGTYSSFQFADRAKALISQHDTSKPMFLYMPFQNVHSPLEVPQKYADMYPNVENKDRKTFSGMVSALDEAIGEVVQALRDKGMYDNTIIFFSSDNGGMPIRAGGNNFPLRGTKATVFEGGTRVPGFVHSPLLPNRGKTYDGMMHAVDWFLTMLEAAGIDYEDPDQDGVSQWPALTTQGNSSRTEFVYNLDHETVPVEGKAAIRMGDYKLIDGYPGLFQGWYPPPDGKFNPTDLMPDFLDLHDNETALIGWVYGRPEAVEQFLFNVKDDPEEKHNLYFRMPSKVAEMRQRLQEYNQRYTPALNPKNDPQADPDLWGGVWSPGWC